MNEEKSKMNANHQPPTALIKRITKKSLNYKYNENKKGNVKNNI